jgi:ABC-type transport system substrate-binding protein
LLGIALLVAACAPVSSSAASGSPGAASLGAEPGSLPTATELRIGVDAFDTSAGDDIVGGWTNGYLFRQDSTLAPIPDLAAAPCEVRNGGRTYRCTLRPTTFHNGTPVTAEDVAFTFAVARAAPCRQASCIHELAGVAVVDPTTIDFNLTRPFSPFVTTVLTREAVLPEHAVRAAYEKFATATAAIDPKVVEAMAAANEAELAKARPACDGLLQKTTRTFESIGHATRQPGEFANASGLIDACGYLGALTPGLHDLASSRAASGLDAIAWARDLTDFATAPIGAGPYRRVRFDGREAVLEAYGGFRFGAPAIKVVRVRRWTDQDEALGELRGGSLDWVRALSSAGAENLAGASDLRIARRPIFGYVALMYNVRAGRLFADPVLREALERCVDKRAIVDAATGGTATAIDTYVPPSSWGYLPSETSPHRDVEAARGMLDRDRWLPGPDGIRVKDGRKLAFDVPVRADADDRVKFVDLLAFQVRDCGMAVTTRPLDFDALHQMIGTYPHKIPGTDKPFEAYLGGWAVPEDPGLPLEFLTREITSDNPPATSGYLGVNFTGFSDRRVDDLVETELQTDDIKDRARLIRELQQIIANDRPYLFAYSPLEFEAVTTRLKRTDGDVALDSPAWSSMPERLVLSR